MHRTTSLLTLSLACVFPILQACGDDADDDDSRDAGPDASAEAGRGGSGGKAGRDAGADAAAEEGDPVTLRFKARFGSEALRCGSEYEGQGSTDIAVTPQDFRFFVEEVTLITREGDARALRFDAREPFQSADVALLDFTDGAGHCGGVGRPTVNTTITGHIEPGDYAGIEFVVGVPERLNHQNIAVAKAPLQDATTHWGWQSGYRFMMVEVLPVQAMNDDTDADADAGSAPGGHGPGGVASFVHIGSGGCKGSNAEGYECSRPNRNRVRLEGFDPEADTIVADVSKVFEAIDLTVRAECHGPDPRCEPAYAALGVDLETGASSEDQTVFRVE